MVQYSQVGENVNKRLIVNADDFGLHASINDGIITGHRQGIITSTSIMPSGMAFEHALMGLMKAPELGVGVHLTVVGAGPVSEPSEVPSLVDEEGMFCPGHPQFIRRYLAKTVNIEEVAREWRAQIRKVQDQGISITHLDSHQHMHILPGLDKVSAALAREFNIPAMRVPDEPYGFMGSGPWSAARCLSRCGLTFLARRARVIFLKAGLKTPDYFFGMLNGGHMEPAVLLAILARLQTGVTEIMVHPGADDRVLGASFPWQYHWQTELAALTDCAVVERVRELGIQLVSFGEC